MGNPSSSSSTRLPVPRLYPLEPRIFTWLPTMLTPDTSFNGPDMEKVLYAAICGAEITDMLTGVSAKLWVRRVAETTMSGNSMAEG